MVMFPNDSTTALDKVTYMTIITIRTAMTGNENFMSNPLKFHFSDLPCDPTSSSENQACTVDLIIQNNEHLNHTATVYSEIVTYCYFDDFQTHTVTCPDGQKQIVECPGMYVPIHLILSCLALAHSLALALALTLLLLFLLCYHLSLYPLSFSLSCYSPHSNHLSSSYSLFYPYTYTYTYTYTGTAVSSPVVLIYKL